MLLEISGTSVFLWIFSKFLRTPIYTDMTSPTTPSRISAKYSTKDPSKSFSLVSSVVTFLVLGSITNWLYYILWFLTDKIKIQNIDCYSWFLELRAVTFTTGKADVNCKKKSTDRKLVFCIFKISFPCQLWNS